MRSILFLSPLLVQCMVLSAQQLPPKRAHHALVYDEENKQIVLTAGSTPVDGGKSFVFYNDMWAFDGHNWNLARNAGDQRSGIGLAFDAKRKQLVSYGGFSGNRALGDLRCLINNDWKVASDAAEMAAAEPGFVYDSHRDCFVAFGGSKERGQLQNTTWEWKDNQWTNKNITGPDGRQAFAMIYDSKRKRTILFGGMGSTPQNIFKDTWEYDGKNWTRVDTAGPARMAMGYAYDSKRGLFIVFGGMGPAGMFGDTWGWDGRQWTQLAVDGPPARAMGYMAYDKDRDKVVLFGGRIKWPQDANDTWEWNGKSWSEIKQ
jgi:hypothetical protein